MSKKIIIANIHNNQKVNDFTYFYIKSLNNPNIMILMEGISDQVTTNPAAMDRHQFLTYKSINTYIKNEPVDGVEKAKTYLEKQGIKGITLNNVAALRLQLELASSFHTKGIEDPILVEEEYQKIISNVQSIELNLDKFVELLSKLNDNPRDKHMLESIKEFDGDCIAIVGAAHLLSWIQGNKLDESISIIVPIYNDIIKDITKEFNEPDTYHPEHAENILDYVKNIVPSSALIDIECSPLTEAMNQQDNERLCIGVSDYEEMQSDLCTIM